MVVFNDFQFKYQWGKSLKGHWNYELDSKEFLKNIYVKYKPKKSVSGY